MRTYLVVGAALACLSIACAQTPTDAAQPLAAPAMLETTVTAGMAAAHANGMAVAVIDGGTNQQPEAA